MVDPDRNKSNSTLNIIEHFAPELTKEKIKKLRDSLRSLHLELTDPTLDELQKEAILKNEKKKITQQQTAEQPKIQLLFKEVKSIFEEAIASILQIANKINQLETGVSVSNMATLQRAQQVLSKINIHPKLNTQTLKIELQKMIATIDTMNMANKQFRIWIAELPPEENSHMQKAITESLEKLSETIPLLSQLAVEFVNGYCKEMEIKNAMREILTKNK